MRRYCGNIHCIAARPISSRPMNDCDSFAFLVIGCPLTYRDTAMKESYFEEWDNTPIMG